MKDTIRNILNPIVPPGGVDDPQYLEAYRRCENALANRAATVPSELAVREAIASGRGDIDASVRAVLALINRCSPDTAGRDAIIEECAKCVPSTWLDSLMVSGVIGDRPDCPSFERLLLAVARRIRALKAPTETSG